MVRKKKKEKRGKRRKKEKNQGQTEKSRKEKNMVRKINGKKKKKEEEKRGKRREKEKKQGQTEKSRYTFECTTWSGLKVRIVGKCPVYLQEFLSLSTCSSACSAISQSHLKLFVHGACVLLVIVVIDLLFTTMFQMSSIIINRRNSLL